MASTFFARIRQSAAKRLTFTMRRAKARSHSIEGCPYTRSSTSGRREKNESLSRDQTASFTGAEHCNVLTLGSSIRLRRSSSATESSNSARVGSIIRREPCRSNITNRVEYYATKSLVVERCGAGIGSNKRLGRRFQPFEINELEMVDQTGIEPVTS